MARRKSTTTAPEVEAPESKQQKQVTLVGRLCADPVLHHTKSGKAVSTIRLAVNPSEGDVIFHNVVVWKRTAEVVCEYMRKGRRVEVVGRTQERTYTAADGTERTVNEVIAFRVDFNPGQSAAPTAEQEVA